MTRFRLTGPGFDIVGAVQGVGGIVTSLARLEAQRRLAEKGRALGIYEPKPGHACVFPHYSALGNGLAVHVPLADASITEVA